jgi:tRNA-dihydrouridine synthase
MIKHLQSLEKKYGKHGIKIFRTFTSYYLKGYRNSRALVNQINCCENSNAAIKAMKEFKTP